MAPSTSQLYHHLLLFFLVFLFHAQQCPAAGGSWSVLLPSIGISAMHAQLLPNDRVVMYDRTDFGVSNISLPNGACRPNTTDCSAHSVEYDVASNTVRPLMVLSNVWCSSGTLMPDGRLVQTGGFDDGYRVVRIYKSCDSCDWQEIRNGLNQQRWYATNHILPDGRQIIIGGRRAFSYEFYPKMSATENTPSLPFLVQTNDPNVENNLYPFVFLYPDGNLFIFANNRAILFDYSNNQVIKTYPTMPDGQPRSYPSTGSAVLLPLRITKGTVNAVEVLVCGGAPKGAFVNANKGIFDGALDTCGRIKISDPNPQWVMETMPLARVMGDMLLLPNAHVLIINGVSAGVAGWELGRNPVLSPVVYQPDKQVGSRFEVQNPSTIPRVYHSTAVLLRKTSSLEREFFVSFLDVLNRQKNKGIFNFTSQFPNYKEVLYKPDFEGKKLGKMIVFDMDMSAGDFLALFYLLKVPIETIYLKAILVTPTGWANAATIDVIYDLLHMMGRDDILVGLGDSFGLNQSYPNDPNTGNCKYSKAIPNGSGGLLDSDTLFGLARDLPRSPRRYTAENSVEFGAPRTTDFPQLRQPLALEVWNSIAKSADLESKITILTNGPLTTLAKIILADTNASSIIQDVFIVGGHINYQNKDNGNVINVPSNKYTELNMFLDPLAAKVVFDSSLDVTLIPLSMQRKVCSFPHIIKKLDMKKKTPEAHFSEHLLTRLYHLQQRNHRYRHMDTFLGEILGAVILAGDQQTLNATFHVRHLKVHATGQISKDGEITEDAEKRKSFKVLERFDHVSFYEVFAGRLSDYTQSSVVGSFSEQKRIWSTPD